MDYQDKGELRLPNIPDDQVYKYVNWSLGKQYGKDRLEVEIFLYRLYHYAWFN